MVFAKEYDEKKRNTNTMALRIILSHTKNCFFVCKYSQKRILVTKNFIAIDALLSNFLKLFYYQKLNVLVYEPAKLKKDEMNVRDLESIDR